MIVIPASFHYGEDNIWSILNVTKPDLILTDDEEINILENVPAFTFSGWDGNIAKHEIDLELDKIEGQLENQKLVCLQGMQYRQMSI